MIADAFADTINRYVDDVLDGTIPASKYVIAAVRRHRDDLAKQSTSDFPYHFDLSAARKVCEFYPRLLRLSTGSFNNVPFELSPFQVFCESMLYGWKRDVDDTRRFRKSYEGVARKNGKSTRAAGRALYMARFDSNPASEARSGKHSPEASSQVILAAMKKEQAEKILYAEIRKMRDRSRVIRDISREVYSTIQFPDNDGLIMCTGSDRSFDGLNPHFICLDELHAWGTYQRDFFDTMLTSVGFRDQPLVSIITTAGDDGSDLWIENYDYACGVVTGTINDDSYFTFSAELDEDDDPFDESTWIKANPNLGVTVGIDYLRGEAKTAKQSSYGFNRFMRYCCNRRTSQNSAAFNLDEWRACRGELSDWAKADAVCGGVDQGTRDDLGAWALVARFIDGYSEQETPIYRYECRVGAWISEETKRDLSKPPFGELLYRGQLRKSRFPSLALRDELIEECHEYRVDRVAYDLYNAQEFGEWITKEHGIEALRVAQTCRWFSEPIKSLQQAIREKRFRHDGNPLLEWCISNAVLVSDRVENVMYDKPASKEKIDAVVALTMAYFACMHAPERSTGSFFVG